MSKVVQCYKCRSSKCYDRVVSSEDNGKTFDEVACSKHKDELYKYSDEVAPKIMKWFITSTGGVKRGEPFLKGDDF